MKAGRIHTFGPPNAIVIDELPHPTPEEGELVVRVAAAGVGPWDALIREGKSVVQLSLPLILGSDLAGIVESVGTGAIRFKPGDEVFGVTNKQFCGAYAEYAVASAQMVAVKPRSLSFAEAASVPVVAVTAYQMLFDHGRMTAGQAVLIHGAAGNVGAYAVQLAKQAGLQVFATAGPGDFDYVRGLGAEMVVNYKTTKFEDVVPTVDAVLDTVGGETQHRSFRVLKPDGILVSVISPPPQRAGFRSEFFLADVTATRLDTLARLLDGQKLTTAVGTALPLEEARKAHEMLAGAPHKRGKIVLTMDGAHWITTEDKKGKSEMKKNYRKVGTNEVKETTALTAPIPSKTLGVNVFTAPGKPMVGERPKPFGEALGFDPATSTLIFGEYDAVLVDAMTTVAEAEALADWIALHNRNLETIYITHAHFDHFYGLSILLDRFPGARAIATPKTVNAMQMSFSSTVERLARRLFPGQVATKLVAPEPYDRDTFTLEGHELRIIEQGQTDSPDSTSLHVPSIGLIVAGDVVYNQCRMYVGETTPESRKNWIAALDRLAALNPAMVVAGHKRPGAPDSPSTIQDTKRYLQDFDRVQKTVTSDQELFDRMTELYPHWVANQSWLMFGFPMP